MDFNTEKCIIDRSEKLFEGTAEQSIDCEINLPDYCSDIQRILKCDAQVNIRALQQTGDRVSAEGDVLLRLIYVNAEEKPDCYEQLLPLSKYVEVKGLDGSFCISAKPNVEFLNCRASSQRRASVNGKIGIRFCVEQAVHNEFISNASGAGVQARTEKAEYDRLLGMTDRAFDMTETVSLSEDEAPVGGVLHCGAVALVESLKSIANKLLIKGELVVELVYFSDNQDRELVTKQHTMPISQIIEINGIDDNSVCCAELSVMSVQLQPKTDSNGDNKLLEVNCRVCAKVKAYERVDTTVLTDSYCMDYEMKNEFVLSELCGAHAHYGEEKSVRAVVDTGASGISVPLCAWCREVSTSAYENEGRLEGKCSAGVCVMYLDSEGKTVYLEKPIDFDFTEELQKPKGKAVCQAKVDVKQIAFTKVGNDKLELKLDTVISSDVYDARVMRICSQMSVDRQQVKKKNHSALTIYFCDSGEVLWDIAKNYCTSVDAIKQENAIEADVVPDRTMLMIPMC